MLGDHRHGVVRCAGLVADAPKVVVDRLPVVQLFLDRLHAAQHVIELGFLLGGHHILLVAYEVEEPRPWEVTAGVGASVGVDVGVGDESALAGQPLGTGQLDRRDPVEPRPRPFRWNRRHEVRDFAGVRWHLCAMSTQGLQELTRLVQLLGARAGLTSWTAIADATGVATTTLGRWRKGEGGGRGDAIKRIAETFDDVSEATLVEVREGLLTADEALRQIVGRRESPQAAGRTGLDDGEAIVSAGMAEIAKQLAEQEETVRKVLVNKLRSAGIQPLWPAPDHPDEAYDVAYRDDDGVLHAIEVKVVGSGSAGVWDGMGRLIALRYELRDEEVRPWLVIERAPTDEEREVLEAQGIEVASLDDWSAVPGESS